MSGNNKETQTLQPLAKTMLITGLFAGTLDILAATLNFLIQGGKNPLNVFNFIASAIFGKAAFSGGMIMALYGLIFHYLIALIWTILLFLAYSKLPILSKNKYVVGIAYGLVVWVIMNLVILPLSNVPKIPFVFTSALIHVVILMVAIGLPISLMASKYFNKVNESRV